MKERAQKDVELLCGSHSCSSHCPRLLWMILSRIRFGNYFHGRRCQDHADRKKTSPRQGAGSHLLCPDGWSLGLIDAILRQPQRLFTNFRAKFPVANASIPDLPAKRVSLKLDGNDTGTSHILRSVCIRWHCYARSFRTSTGSRNGAF
jgi:hypothetical protein